VKIVINLRALGKVINSSTSWWVTRFSKVILFHGVSHVIFIVYVWPDLESRKHRWLYGTNFVFISYILLHLIFINSDNNDDTFNLSNYSARHEDKIIPNSIKFRSAKERLTSLDGPCHGSGG
jgi:hypothetical protein